MGYSTDFFGEFEVTPTLKPEHAAYLRKFTETRRMKRDAAKTAARPDPIREAVGLPVGVEGCYFVGAEEGWGAPDIGVDLKDRAVKLIADVFGVPLPKVAGG